MQRRPSKPDLVMHSNGPSDIPEDGSLLSPQTPGTLSPVVSDSTRYRRASLNRARSSAASSRRNSLSSTQSHGSYRSRPTLVGPQSTHVAQHLRRASILESRKARLAARAVHAEQVRLRAALAKAAPRQSNSEERALAAQQAREKHLAQVAASCAGEVRRAKRIAEDMKERREVEEKRARDDMEERQADAEKRRSDWLDKRSFRKSRTGSIAAADAKKGPVMEPLVELRDNAARKIQKFWRSGLCKQTAMIFQALDLTVDSVKAKSMEEVGALLAEERVINIAAKTLRVCGLLDALNETEQITAVKTFLCTFLILGHPAEVLRDDGEQEQDLVQKATALLVAFVRLVTPISQSIRFTPSANSIASLKETNLAFTNAFAAWKAHDSTLLVQTMIAQYVELDLIWQKVKDDTEEIVALDYRQGIRDAQIMLLVRIKRMAGPERAKALIRDAIRDARRKRLKKPTGDVRPRAAEVLPPVPSFNDLEPNHTAALVAAEEAVAPPKASPTPEQSRAHPPLQQIFLSKLPDNRSLVHELSINKNFRIDSIDPELNEYYGPSILGSMRKDLEAGKGGPWIINMTSFIRSSLSRLVRPESAIGKVIQEVLDPELVKNQVSRGAFSHAEFFKFMDDIFPKICAPARDEAIKALPNTEGDEVDRVEAIFKILDLLHLDHANFTLQLNKANLIKAAPAYEASKFEKDLQDGVHNLSRARSWYLAAREKVMAETQRFDPEGIRHPRSQPSFTKIYSTALVDLVGSMSMTRTMVEDVLPETLKLDLDRINHIQGDLLFISLASSILLTAKNLLKLDVRIHWKEPAQKLLALLWDFDGAFTLYDVAQPLVTVITESQGMDSQTEERLKAYTDKIMSQAVSGEILDPVLRLLQQRLRTHLLSRLSVTTARERVTAESNASEILAKSGMPEYGSEVGKVMETLNRIKDVDVGSHSRWWTEIEQTANDSVDPASIDMSTR